VGRHQQRGSRLTDFWTEGTKRDANFSVEEIVRWCCRNTAKQVGLEKTKGDLGVGFDADVVVFDDEGTFMVSLLPVFIDFWLMIIGRT